MFQFVRSDAQRLRQCPLNVVACPEWSMRRCFGLRCSIAFAVIGSVLLLGSCASLHAAGRSWRLSKKC